MSKRSEPNQGANPAEARDHLVGNEQDAVAVADLPDAAPVALRARPTTRLRSERAP